MAQAPKRSLKSVGESFRKTLKKLMDEKGMTQAELCREASHHLGSDIGRYNISYYLSGRSKPNKERRDAIAAALGVSGEELIPDSAVTPRSDGVGMSAPMEMSQIPGTDQVRLKIDQVVPWDLALKILEVLKGDEKRVQRKKK